MRRFILRIATVVCLSSWLLASPLVVSEQLSADDIASFAQQYGSASKDERIILLRDFAITGPENYGDASIDIIESALLADDPEIRYLGLGSLHRLTAARPDLVDVQRFRPLIKSASQSSDANVRAQAVAVASSLSQREESFASILVEALEGASSPSEAADIIRKLPPGVVREPDVTRDLIAMSQTSAGPVSFEAACTLLRSDVYAPQLLPELVRLIQDDSYFGRQVLTEGIAQYETDAAAYVPILAQVRDELQADLQRSPFERTKNVHHDRNGAINIIEDPGAVEALDDLIQSLHLN